MTKPLRLKLKRDLAQALHHLQVASDNLGTVYEEFEGVHDDYANSLVMLAQSIELIKGGILAFWESAWGDLPDNIDSYRC